MKRLIEIWYLTNLEQRGQLAEKFANDHYQKKLGAIPPPSDEYVVAMDALKVLGTLCIDYPKKEDVFFEKVYTLPKKVPIAGFTKEASVYFSKFTSIESWVSPCLMYYAALKGLEKEHKFGVAILEDGMIKYLKRFYGLEWKLWSSEINFENVSKEVSRYFSKKPEPKLYMVELAQMEKKLESVALS